MLFKKIQGATLIELIMGMAMGVLIIIAACVCLSMIRSSLLTHLDIIKQQNNMRGIQRTFQKVFVEAGNMGCNRFHEGLSRYHDTSIDLSRYLLDDRSIQITHFDLLKHHPLISMNFLDMAERTSDVLWVVSSNELDTNNLDDNPNPIVMRSDCQNISFYHLAEMNNQKENIRKLSSKLYYIRKTNRLSSSDYQHALYTTDLNGQTIELFEGVEQMKWSWHNNEKGKIQAAFCLTRHYPKPTSCHWWHTSWQV